LRPWCFVFDLQVTPASQVAANGEITIQYTVS
jgi:hypothetical protein